MNSKRELPKTVNVPMPPARSANNSGGPEAYAPRGHNSFLTQAMHEDVGRVMQNIIDLQTEVTMLREQRMEWERRALLAEGKVKQLGEDILETRLDTAKETARVQGIHEAAMAHVQKELDYFKNRDAVVQTKLTIGAKHFLDCIQAIEQQEEVKVLSGMEEELTKYAADKDSKLSES